jgi:hypothetical protein
VVEDPPIELVCSAKGCRAHAVYQLHWNNPKLHTPARRKTWLACADHLDRLTVFLRSREFLREVTPLPTGTPGTTDDHGAAPTTSSDHDLGSFG